MGTLTRGNLPRSVTRMHGCTINLSPQARRHAQKRHITTQDGWQHFFSGVKKTASGLRQRPQRPKPRFSCKNLPTNKPIILTLFLNEQASLSCSRYPTMNNMELLVSRVPVARTPLVACTGLLNSNPPCASPLLFASRNTNASTAIRRGTRPMWSGLFW